MKRAFAFGLVFVQLLLLAALIFLPQGALWTVSVATIVAAIVLGAVGAILAILGVVGLGPALTASPIPREHTRLVTSGVYGIVRNPIYTGLIIGGLGLALFGASVWHITTWAALVVLLSVKTRWEERMLATERPGYGEYAARVGRFVPRIGRLRPPN